MDKILRFGNRFGNWNVIDANMASFFPINNRFLTLLLDGLLKPEINILPVKVSFYNH